MTEILSSEQKVAYLNRLLYSGRRSRLEVSEIVLCFVSFVLLTLQAKKIK